MKSTQTQDIALQIANCDRLNDWASGNRPDFSEWEALQLQLEDVAAAALQADHPEFHQLARTMGQLVEIAGCSMDLPETESGFSSDDIMDFVESCLGMLVDEEAELKLDQVQAKLEFASFQWEDQLKVFEEHHDDYELGGFGESGFDSEEDVDDAATDPSQIGLMLSVLNGGPETAETQNTVVDLTEQDESQPSTQENNKQEPTAACFEPGAGLPQPPSEMIISDEIKEDQELCQAYLDDAYGCLERMEQVVLDAETSENHAECIRDFCRQLHTIKGASASVGLGELANYLHQVEEWLEHKNKDAGVKVDEGMLLSAIDSVRKQVGLLDPEAQPADATADSAPANSAGVSPQAAVATPTLSSSATRSSSNEASIRVRATQLDRLMDMLAELVVIRNRRENGVGELSQLNHELSQCTTRLKKFSDQQHELFRSLSSDGFRDIRKESSLNLGYEPTSSNAMQEVANDLNEIARGVSRYCEPVSEENLALSHFIRQFRQELMQLRRLPVAGLFQRLQRAARDAGNVENKKVRVQLVGEDTGLEQSLQEQLFEPLMHVVRNAVGHGIEDPQSRKASKKSETGTITLRAQANANLLVITIADDGKGMDYDALRQRGYERGLLPTERAPTRQELANLIFHPGFSTRDQASEVAGRGIGMDVVANAINRLRGRIEIDSTAGKGTEMRFSIPLQSGIEHTMVFRACGQLFALPMRAVSVAEIDGDESPQNADVVGVHFAQILGQNYEGSVSEHYLILEADQHMAMKGGQGNSADSTAPSTRFGMLVEDVVGPEEVVVRNLPPMLHGHPMIRGVVLAANGEIVMLLDAERLLEFCMFTQSTARPQNHAGTSKESEPVVSAGKVLVVDDSLSARRSLVKRLKKHQFEIVEAGDGIEALDRLRSERFDLILTDLDMPRMGGLELLSEVQRSNSIEAPAVVASSRTQESIKRTATEHGAAAFLNKPVTDEVLSNALKQLNLI